MYMYACTLNYHSDAVAYCMPHCLEGETSYLINIAQSMDVCLFVCLFVCLTEHHVRTERPRGLKFCPVD